MIEAQPQFNKRLSNLQRKHAKMTRGYSMTLRRDGLIVAKPKRSVSRGFPAKGLLGLVFGFFVFKALVLGATGEITYNERVAKLHQGTAIEQGGAWMMQIDPVTQYLAGYIAPLVK